MDIPEIVTENKAKKSPRRPRVSLSREQSPQPVEEVVPSHDRPRSSWWRLMPIVLWIVVLAVFSVTLYLVSPDAIIAHIGVSNAYAIIFILSILGGMMTFSGIPYHLFLVTFVLSGLNPYLLGMIAGIGVTIGDMTSYMAGYYGRALVPRRIEVFMSKLEVLRESHPRLLPLIFLLYGSLVPYSSDVLTVPMGLIRYPFWKLMIPLGIGSMIFNVGLALLAAHAYEYLGWLL